MIVQAFYPRAEAASRSDLVDLERRMAKKSDREAMEVSIAAKVRMMDDEMDHIAVSFMGEPRS